MSVSWLTVGPGDIIVARDFGFKNKTILDHLNKNNNNKIITIMIYWELQNVQQKVLLRLAPPPKSGDGRFFFYNV